MHKNAPIQEKDAGGRIDPAARRYEGRPIDRHHGHGCACSPANRHAKSNG